MPRKAASRLKPKLQDRGLLDSQSIEGQIKDLAGARLIFYTNTDVDRFLNSRLIPDNFEVQWDETKIHHPTEENPQQRYQAIHYTVCLNSNRTALPEYAEIQRDAMRDSNPDDLESRLGRDIPRHTLQETADHRVRQ